MGKDLMSLAQWNYSGSQIFERGAVKIIFPCNNKQMHASLNAHSNTTPKWTTNRFRKNIQEKRGKKGSTVEDYAEDLQSTKFSR